ncbi:S-adenosylmethionine-dependent methyltransferase [Ascoidea rubescens DSM 1968]|uniref:Histone-lysine N-methyltransferase SET5 n=1 Tax=Ascoidea rubescens DSM 1968 TaxID=1344418 RepID=A0A1D2VJZ8_9ASCO|nr:SET domain-containing protein [Ascoidea rubescens DSM 1968]ODV61942.1 SET domain-containing protein [Ascoidea rubescens DSM 1968]
MVKIPIDSTLLSNKFEILEINDKSTNNTDTSNGIGEKNLNGGTNDSTFSDPYGLDSTIPHEREVCDQVIEIWKKNPENESLSISKLRTIVKYNNPNWELSEKRLKSILKSFNLLPSNIINNTFVSKITSYETPGLDINHYTPANSPNSIKIQSSLKKGKGIFALKKILKDTLLWQETPFLLHPPLDHLNLIKNSYACTYCGKLLVNRKNKSSFLNGLDCKYCNESWCSKNCKKLDTLHVFLNHNNHSNQKVKLNSKNWLIFKNHCAETNWNGLFAVGYIYAKSLLDKVGEEFLSKFKSFATIPLNEKFLALNPNSKNSFVYEQSDQLWQTGFQKLNDCFPDNPLSFENYMLYIGGYNLNNISDALFLVQSHLNHNCDYNVDVKFDDLSPANGIKVYAKRDINPHEELFTSYVSPTFHVNQRRKELRENWGFLCSCKRCKNELKLEQKRKSSFGSIAQNNPQTQTQKQNQKKNQKKSNSDSNSNPSPNSKPNSNSNSNANSRSSSISILRSHSLSQSDRKKIRDMLKNVGKVGDFDLDLPGCKDNGDLYGTQRRKSVRFDEKVVAVKSDV